MSKKHYFLGLFEGHVDPAAALVCDGRIIAYSEEERHTRYKHAPGDYPIRALKYCLDTAGITLDQVAGVGVNWNVTAFTDGTMEAFFTKLGQTYQVNPGTRSWQKFMLNKFNADNLRILHHKQWRRAFGDMDFPPLIPLPHHYTHAAQAFFQSPFHKALCLTIDGSGDQHCTVIWKCEGEKITPIKEILIPNSLGWLYAAFTEYLGFRAYDGEYKVMGLAAYGQEDPELSAKLDQIVTLDVEQGEYQVDPSYIHYGEHTYSDRYTDKLVTLFGRKPRISSNDITKWHENLAFAVQRKLEQVVVTLAEWAIAQTGITNICVGGGVGHNVKLNERLFESRKVEDIFIHPLCSDGGSAQGVALAACNKVTGILPEKLTTLAMGWNENNQSIEATLKLAQLDYEKPDDIFAATAKELAKGRIVGWFQGRMEAGPRALGQRSILADPRNTENRDKVNSIIKFREYWRPFCPSMIHEAAERYFDQYTEAPFMVIAFHVNQRLKKDAPAIVHTDDTARVQLVREEVLPRYHRLLKAFEECTGVPVLLNTSFNIKGEPVVCTVTDALRTFWATGLDILVLEDFMIKKPRLG